MLKLSKEESIKSYFASLKMLTVFFLIIVKTNRLKWADPITLSSDDFLRWPICHQHVQRWS